MIDIHVPSSLEYNTANTALVAAALNDLHTFDEIAGWNKKATAEVEGLHFILKAIEEKQLKVTQILSRERQDHEAKPFLNRLFAGRKELKKWLAERSRLAMEKDHLENLIDQFESVMELIPASPDELRELLETCKRQKLELMTEKKAVNAQMSSIRVEARQQNANTSFGKYGKGERHRIKLNTQSALRHQSNQKVAVRRQINELDQKIKWLEGFKLES